MRVRIISIAEKPSARIAKSLTSTDLIATDTSAVVAADMGGSLDTDKSAPHVSPGGLITVAFLKAQLDTGSDHLGIFLPLIYDVLASLPSHSFTAAEVRDRLADRHGVSMVLHTVETLLSRVAKKKVIQRNHNFYSRVQGRTLPTFDIVTVKRRIEGDQLRLAKALQSFSNGRNPKIESPESALALLLAFLEAEQVSMLLESESVASTEAPPDQARVLIAEFVESLIPTSDPLLDVIREMLEGLVLYHAAFLPDIGTVQQRLTDLKVIFDSTLVRQFLDYEGLAPRVMMREAVDVIVNAGAQCYVLDRTVAEIDGILRVFEEHLATASGRESLRPTEMSRHFLRQRYGPGDVAEMRALLQRDILAAGFHIIRSPQREAEFNPDESKLAARLVDPLKRDDQEPRVIHDVECVMAVQHLRRGHRSSRLADSAVVFATASRLLVKNTQLWWTDDERESGISPVVHIRALTNRAWLARPKIAKSLKTHELVALCSAVLKPSTATWQQFIKHLRSLRKSGRITSDEVAEILISSMADRLLREAEAEHETDSIPAVTFDDVLERLNTSRRAEEEKRVQQVSDEYEQKLASAEAQRRAESERAAKLDQLINEDRARTDVRVERQAQRVSRAVSRALRVVLSLLTFAGAVALLLSHPFHGTFGGVVVFLCISAFVAVEAFGVLDHLGRLCDYVERKVRKAVKDSLLADEDDATGTKGETGPSDVGKKLLLR